MTPNDVTIRPVRTPGLGDTSYVVAHDGVGFIVDPQRDVGRFTDVLADLGAEPRWVFETHLHNDYVSGSVVAAQQTGAELVVPAPAAPAYRHTPAFHLEDIRDSGPLAIRPIHTPGHTPEHTSYLLLFDDEPIAVFSGGSLIVGSAGRSDLLGLSRSDSLARLQYGSVHRLAGLPDTVGLFPTHGGGSFCAVSGGATTTSTIGAERLTNPVLAYPDEDSFVRGQLSALQPYPTYYQHMGPVNLDGGAQIRDLPVPRMSGESMRSLPDDVAIIDIRPAADYATAHIPGSLAIEHREDFATWAGWLVDIATPIVLVSSPDRDAANDAILQLARIGYDNVIGVFTEFAAWVEDGNPIRSTTLVDLKQFIECVRAEDVVIDVRSPVETAAGVIEGSIEIYVPDIVGAELTPGTVPVLACGSGFRAMIAASLLERRDIPSRVMIGNGVPEAIRALSA